MITVRFNEEDIARIMGRLNATLSQSAGYKFKWKLKLLKQYKVAVQTAMGTVEARGGYPHIVFESTTSTQYWNSLRPGTIKAKLKRRGTRFSKEVSGNPSKLYSQYASKLTIWYDTGETKEAVTVTAEEDFAGITGGDALTKAHRVEEGGGSPNFKKRPLFAYANWLIINTIRTMLTNDESWLAKAMRREFCSLAKSNGWGS